MQSVATDYAGTHLDDGEKRRPDVGRIAALLSGDADGDLEGSYVFEMRMQNFDDKPVDGFARPSLQKLIETDLEGIQIVDVQGANAAGLLDPVSES